MSSYLEAIRTQAGTRPSACAFANTAGERLSYGQLWRRSDALAVWLAAHNAHRNPVCLYGHKQALMLVGMLACMKAGAPYVPIESSQPPQRTAAILGQLAAPIVCCAAPLAAGTQLPGAGRIVAGDELTRICAAPVSAEQLAALTPVAGDDAIYLLFTSGSTGTPKGVVQRAESVDLTSAYFTSLVPLPPNADGPLVCFNRAPFSFDLSIFDLLIALPGGHTMFALDEAAEASLAATFSALRDARVGLWVSTPSFLTMCLADPAFGPELLPQLQAVLLCGETLPNSTARAFLQRFSGAGPAGQVRLVNLYGPSETCGAVTDVLVTARLAHAREPLPVGTPSPYSSIVIADPATLEELPCNTTGEILILGRTAAAGYHGLPEKTAAAFSTRPDADGTLQRCYRTGDEGFLDADGMLHYLGRFDLQLKLNGYRIELGDVEENLGSLPDVAACCVVPVLRGDTCTALAAHVVPACGIAGGRALTKQLKAALHGLLPGYMVPRTFTYHDALPTTVNGKVDRKALQEASAPRRRTREG